MRYSRGDKKPRLMMGVAVGLSLTIVCVCESGCLRECMCVCVCVRARATELRERRGEKPRERKRESERDQERERDERGERQGERVNGRGAPCRKHRQAHQTNLSSPVFSHTRTHTYERVEGEHSRDGKFLLSGRTHIHIGHSQSARGPDGLVWSGEREHCARKASAIRGREIRLPAAGLGP